MIKQPKRIKTYFSTGLEGQERKISVNISVTGLWTCLLQTDIFDAHACRSAGSAGIFNNRTEESRQLSSVCLLYVLADNRTYNWRSLVERMT
jgi:hypothetical protein